MKFIFPQNYNFKNKLFGIFDYTTILVNILWSAFILIIINFFVQNLNIKIFIAVIVVISPFIACRIVLNKVSGAIQTIINKNIQAKTALQTEVNTYLSKILIFIFSKKEFLFLTGILFFFILIVLSFKLSDIF